MMSKLQSTPGADLSATTAAGRTPGPNNAPSRRALQLLLLASATIVAGFLFLEGLCSVSWLFVDLRAFYRSRPFVTARLLEEHHVEYDPVLGWRNIPGKRIENLYGPGKSITITADGFRGLEPVLDPGPGGRYRVVCVGDSFTLGYGVDDRETYPHLLQSVNGALQTVNMGQGGYSVGQSYLWYRGFAERLRGDAVIFAFIVDDMLRLEGARNESGHGRPVFSFVDGKMSVSNQPVPPKIEFGRRMIETGETMRFVAKHSPLARTLGSLTGRLQADASSRDQDLLPLMLAMFEDLDRDSRSRNRTFAVVMLPTSRDLPGQADYSYVNDQYYRSISAAVRQFTEERGIRFLDLHPRFAAPPPAVASSLFLDEAYHHYSPFGNEFVARHLNGWLSEVVPGFPVH